MEEIIYDFDPEKNIKLKENRGVSFEDIISLIEEKRIVDIIEHSNRVKYPNQQMFVVDIEGYIYLVPFIKNHKTNTIFLKTIFASRKETKRYLSEKKSGGGL